MKAGGERMSPLSSFFEDWKQGRMGKCDEMFTF